MYALVADAHLRNAVAGLRALGRAGVPAIALGRSRVAAGMWSRQAAGRERCPEPGDGWRGFADAVTRVVGRHGPAVVYPGQETSVEVLLRHGSDLPQGAVLPYPDASAVRALREKSRLPDLAAASGLGAPRTLFEGTASELREAAAALPECTVVKPAGAVGALPTASAVGSRAALEHLAAGLPADAPLIVQERIRGPLASLALVVDREGVVVARFQEQATRTWPREAGSFAATESVEPDEGLVERTRAMLAGAGYAGLAQLDLVMHEGEPVLLDVNPRFYSCMPLALACGVNLPAAWHAVVEGRDAGPPPAYPVGRTYRWLEGDLYGARHGDLRGLMGRGRRADAGAMWDAADPVASALLAADCATLPVRRRLRSLGGGR